MNTEGSTRHPYDDNGRYEKIKDGVYRDLETNETVFLVSPDEQQQWAPIIQQKRKEQEEQRSAKDRWDLFRAEVLLTLGVSPSIPDFLERSDPEKYEELHLGLMQVKVSHKPGSDPASFAAVAKGYPRAIKAINSRTGNDFGHPQRPFGMRRKETMTSK